MAITPVIAIFARNLQKLLENFLKVMYNKDLEFFDSRSLVWLAKNQPQNSRRISEVDNHDVLCEVS